MTDTLQHLNVQDSLTKLGIRQVLMNWGRKGREGKRGDEKEGIDKEMDRQRDKGIMNRGRKREREREREKKKELIDKWID